jgi:hypothetical protein
MQTESDRIDEIALASLVELQSVTAASSCLPQKRCMSTCSSKKMAET